MDKIVCLGKNYVAHIQEIGEKIPEKPVIFMKPPSAMKTVENGKHFNANLPAAPGIVHAECELVFRLARGGYRLSADQAKDLLEAVTVGLDMTLWEKHNELKQNRHPWTVCKAFPESAIVGPWRKVKDFPRFMDEEFSLSVDGVGKQAARGSEMMLKPADSISYISQFLLLEPGDLIFTGTPQGVLSIASGQTGHLKFLDFAYSVSWKELNN
jgi:2-keto-4-pentenoate hydratase/2-oxohepta-3-ene-1,7-dioic acid hydratase in catechol pathway